MKHMLIGTAGHVDHGKTALIHTLTGIETDRLKEEKKRGITIDLGFAYIDLPDGQRASIIDVPGHEKFIKNMLAGAGGIDLVLLVIAADDGVMPQTREHFGILQLLGAKEGIIVLTKCDLADDEWIGMVSEDIRSITEKTFLQDAPLVCVSSHTGQGIDVLRELIAKKISAAAPKNTSAPFRLPVDRVFTMEGFGTVITGTLIEGALHLNDQVTIYPQGKPARVRSLQVHGADVETAYAGQRVAVNLSRLKLEDVLRGDTLAAPDSLQPTRMLDVKISVMKDSPREILNGSRLHFYYGTRNVLCKAVLMDAEKLPPGGEGYAQLRFMEEVAIKRGDPFVLRFYSPTETVGGGVVLNENPKKHRKGRAAESIQALETLEYGDVGDHILQAISAEGIVNLDELQKRFALEQNDWNVKLEELESQGLISMIGDKNAMDYSFRENLGDKLMVLLKHYHKDNPLHEGMKKEELRSRILPGQKPAFFDQVLQLYANMIRVNDRLVALNEFEITYTKEQNAIREDILAKLKQGGFAPPSVDELLAIHQKNKNKKLSEQVLEAMINEGAVILAGQEIIFEAAIVEKAMGIFADIAKQENGSVTLAQFRDDTQTSRKFALSLLEYFDRIGFTRKVDDSRVFG